MEEKEHLKGRLGIVGAAEKERKHESSRDRPFQQGFSPFQGSMSSAINHKWYRFLQNDITLNFFIENIMSWGIVRNLPHIYAVQIPCLSCIVEKCGKERNFWSRHERPGLVACLLGSASDNSVAMLSVGGRCSTGVAGGVLDISAKSKCPLGVGVDSRPGGLLSTVNLEAFHAVRT